MLTRDDDENWSYPAFYTMGSLTLGLQIGGEISEIALVIMTKAARDSLLSNDFRLGGDISPVRSGPAPRRRSSTCWPSRAPRADSTAA
jgi:lipid-binding SYLF domain-containing protein